jgi:hypothetical protein
VLYVLERYVRRVEWFDRDELHRRYREAVAAGHVGEDVYNLDLQRFLFIEGDYITYAKPRSASGEADVIGELDTDDPLVYDGKIFDGEGRGKSYLAMGFNQIIQYAQDHQGTSPTWSSSTSPAGRSSSRLTERLTRPTSKCPASASTW